MADRCLVYYPWYSNTSTILRDPCLPPPTLVTPEYPSLTHIQEKPSAIWTEKMRSLTLLRWSVHIRNMVVCHNGQTLLMWGWCSSVKDVWFVIPSINSGKPGAMAYTPWTNLQIWAPNVTRWWWLRITVPGWHCFTYEQVPLPLSLPTDTQRSQAVMSKILVCTPKPVWDQDDFNDSHNKNGPRMCLLLWNDKCGFVWVICTAANNRLS